MCFGLGLFGGLVRFSLFIFIYYKVVDWVGLVLLCLVGVGLDCRWVVGGCCFGFWVWMFLMVDLGLVFCVWVGVGWVVVCGVWWVWGVLWVFGLVVFLSFEWCCFVGFGLGGVFGFWGC